MPAASPDVERPISFGRHEYFVTASTCPQVLLRILGLLAQQSLVPQSICCEQRESRLDARIVLKGLADERAQILKAKIENIVMVRNVVLQQSAGGGHADG